jgi:hypothetical protein
MPPAVWAFAGLQAAALLIAAIVLRPTMGW